MRIVYIFKELFCRFYCTYDFSNLSVFSMLKFLRTRLKKGYSFIVLRDMPKPSPATKHITPVMLWWVK